MSTDAVHWLAHVTGTAVWRRHHCADGTPKVAMTREQAQNAAAWLNAHRDEPVDAYECWCGAHHVGRRPVESSGSSGVRR
jgi:hypothetical protein